MLRYPDLMALCCNPVTWKRRVQIIVCLINDHHRSERMLLRRFGVPRLVGGSLQGIELPSAIAEDLPSPIAKTRHIGFHDNLVVLGFELFVNTVSLKDLKKKVTYFIIINIILNSIFEYYKF